MGSANPLIRASDLVDVLELRIGRIPNVGKFLAERNPDLQSWCLDPEYHLDYMDEYFIRRISSEGYIVLYIYKIDDDYYFKEMRYGRNTFSSGSNPINSGVSGAVFGIKLLVPKYTKP